MKKESLVEMVEQATGQLRDGSDVDDLSGFERAVWAEIALHDERWTARIVRFFRERISSVSVPVVAGSMAVAVLLGVFSAIMHANAYGKSRADEMEQLYVATIHPVLRTESGKPQQPELP